MHVLPFYLPYDGADAGFDPVARLTVIPGWAPGDELPELAAERDVVAILIAIQIGLAPFLDVLERGDGSPRCSFLRPVLAGRRYRGRPAPRRWDRPGLPFSPVCMGGRQRLA